MENQIVDNKKVLTYAGAFIAFLIGSGFATGQEIMQYFTSYGFMGIAGAVVTLALLVYVGISFITAGYREKFEKGTDIYKYFCGKYIGTFFDYFSILFIYLSFTVMIAGAGATFNEHFGLPVYIGAICMTTVVSIVVLFGLNKIVEIIGKIGPAIVIISILLGIYTIATNFDSLATATSDPILETVTQASSHWFLAALSYVGFSMLWLAGFLASIGAKANSNKEAARGAMFGATGFSVAIIIITLALLSCIQDVAGLQIPSLALAVKVHPIFASVFSLIIIAGIFTTAVPLLWSVSSRFTEEKTTNFRVLTIILAIAGLIIGIRLPFDRLVNIVYVINGYVGIFLLLIMIFKDTQRKLSENKQKENCVVKGQEKA